MRIVVLVLVGLVACSRSDEHVRSRGSQLVAFDADGAFGTQAVTTTSSPHTFTVRPASPSDSLQFDRIETIESTCPEFQITAPDAAGAIVQRTCSAFGGGGYGGGGDVQCVAFAEQTYTFSVQFAPVVQLPSSDQCRIIVRLDGGVSKSIAVSGTGIAPPLAAEISPRTPIDFFTVNLTKTSALRSFSVRNAGSEALTVSATTSLANGVFAVTGTTAQHDLAPGESEDFLITCTPPTADVFTGSITITTTDPDPDDAEVPITFTCQGIDHPVQSIDAAEVVATVGTTRTVIVTLDNLTTDPVEEIAVELQQPALPGLVISAPPATSLGALGSTTVELTWTPPEPYKGALGGLILSVKDQPPRAIGIAMSHARIADVSSDMPANEKLDFGRMCIGEAKVRSFRMQPGGTDSNVFTDYTVMSVAGSAPFTAAIAAGSALVQVAPPTAVAIDVTAMPMISDGTFEGTVTVTTDSPSEGSYTVPVIAEVLQGGTTVNPPLLDFRGVVVTGFSETKTATFTNCTAGPIEITGIALDGDSASDFDINQITPNDVDQLPPFTLPRGGEVVIAVQMLPQSDGTKQARVNIDYQEPGAPATSEETVALLGEGLLRAPDRGSYYHCSTGSPLHAAPIGLVFAFIILRRRRRN